MIKEDLLEYIMETMRQRDMVEKWWAEAEVIEDKTEVLTKIAKELYHDFDGKVYMIKDQPEEEHFGWADQWNKRIVIPSYLWQRSGDSLRHYIAHELSHIASGSGDHGKRFYESFVKICPKNLWRFEIHYAEEVVDDLEIRKKVVDLLRSVDPLTGERRMGEGDNVYERIKYKFIGLDDESSWDELLE